MTPVTQVPTPQTIQHDSHQQADSMDIDEQHNTPTPGDYPVDETNTQGELPDDIPSTPIRGGTNRVPSLKNKIFNGQRPQKGLKCLKGLSSLLRNDDLQRSLAMIS